MLKLRVRPIWPDNEQGTSTMREETIQRLNVVCRELTKIAEMVRRDEKDILPTRDHIEIIKHFNSLRLANEAIKESRDALGEMADRLSREHVPNIMAEHNVRTITVEGVGRVSVGHRFSCSMLDKELGMDWLRNNGHGGLIIETVNSSTLGAFARSQLEEGEELPNEIFKTSTSPYTSITKAGVISNGK